MTVHTTPHALAWLGFELAEIDARLKDVSAAVRDLGRDEIACAAAVEPLRRLRLRLRRVWDLIDLAASDAARR